MVATLLDFIRAERDANWEHHLASAAQMLPYILAYDHTHYTRWASVYLTNMKLLPHTAPEVHQEFMQGNFTVKRSDGAFNNVWSDMALEQSVNRDSMCRGGIVGITKKEGALTRWFLTSHKRAEITGATTSMCGLDGHAADNHVEPGSQRRKRDEADVQAVITTITGQMINPFTFHPQDDEKPTSSPLMNISTGTVADDDVQTDLRRAKQVGLDGMQMFAEERLHSQEKGFFDTLPKNKLRQCNKGPQIKESLWPGWYPIRGIESCPRGRISQTCLRCSKRYISWYFS